MRSRGLTSSNQSGAAPVLVISDFLLAVLLITAIAFGWWAYHGRQDYKNGVDKKIAAAVAKAKLDQKAELTKQFNEQAKSPYKTYSGSPTYGTVNFSYPKTWNAYIDETSSNQPLNAYYYPDFVPSVQSNIAYALRVQLVSDAYESVLNGFSGALKNGSLQDSPFIPSKMKGVKNAQIGSRLDGAIAQNRQGSLVILKVRDKSLEISTQSNDFLSDFNNVILPSLTYVP